MTRAIILAAGLVFGGCESGGASEEGSSGSGTGSVGSVCEDVFAELSDYCSGAVAGWRSAQMDAKDCLEATGGSVACEPELNAAGDAWDDLLVCAGKDWSSCEDATTEEQVAVEDWLYCQEKNSASSCDFAMVACVDGMIVDCV